MEKALKDSANFVCPSCGGPAEMETFWSTSPERPGVKILKRQIVCGKRPRRGFRNRPNPNCPVLLEEIGCEPTAEPRPHLSIVQPKLPARAQPPAPLKPQLELDAVIDFLAQLPHEAVTEVVQLARLQYQYDLVRNQLELRLPATKKAR